MSRIDVRGLFNELGIRSWKRVGSSDEYTASCPFKENHPHGDRNPSFGFNAESGLWLCRSCGEKGNLVQLVQKVLGCDFHEARRTASEYGDEQDLMRLLEQSDESVEPTLRGAFIPGYTQTYHPYWSGRRIDDRSAYRYKLGYDSTQNKPVVPHIWHGEVVGWQKRCLDGSGPKWQSSPGFPKSTTIFGVDQIQRGGVVTVVEAPVSAIYLTQLGYPAVATFGASVSYEQSVEIRKRWDAAIVWFDPDDAGRIGMEKLVSLLIDYMPVWCVVDAQGDPNDLDEGQVRQEMMNLIQVHGVRI